MTRSGGGRRARVSNPSAAYRRWAYQVRIHYLRLYQVDIYADMGLRAAVEALRTNWRLGVGPMDAARGIHATEVDHD